jgi:hypothetical protein
MIQIKETLENNKKFIYGKVDKTSKYSNSNSVQKVAAKRNIVRERLKTWNNDSDIELNKVVSFNLT